MCDPVNILDGPIDRYNGILIDTDIANIVNNSFREQLESIIHLNIDNYLSGISFRSDVIMEFVSFHRIIRALDEQFTEDDMV